jgi:dephospho-CoA kinase
MELIGLTGGIGSGKSTVSGYLRELGATVIDADEGARAVVEPGTPGFERVVAEFGPGIVREGRLDRAKLAEVVFHDAEALAKLNSITHPLVREWSAGRMAEAAGAGVDVVVQDIPLLFENGLEAIFPTTIVVWVPAEVQVQRLVARGMAEEDARARIANQLPIDTKRERARYVIDNSGSREETRAQSETVWTSITDGQRGAGPPFNNPPSRRGD